jgi:hypothetical protein
MMDSIDQRLNYAQFSAEDIDRKLISTDNYIEKYLPLKIHKFIISSLRNVFDSKKDLKKLKDYESRRDWLLNEAIQNDNGIPGDFKKAIQEDVQYKQDKIRINKKSRKPKEPKVTKDSIIVDSPVSKANSSVISPSVIKSKMSNKMNDKDKSISKRSISYQNSAQEEEMLNKILETPEAPRIEVFKEDSRKLTLQIEDIQKNINLEEKEKPIDEEKEEEPVEEHNRVDQSNIRSAIKST